MSLAGFVPSSELKARIPNGTHLVSTDFIRALRGVSAEAVQHAAEAGELRFVWDVNAKRRSRIAELRFWIGEIVQPIPKNITLADVIELMLGARRQSWHSAEVGQMLMVSRPCLHRLWKSGALNGEITNRLLTIPRPALERFLTDRSLWNRG